MGDFQGHMSDNTFVPVTEFVDEDGIVLVPVTARDARGTRRFSFAFLRKIQKAEGEGRTHWLQRHHLAAVRKLIDQLDDWLQREEEKLRVGKRANGQAARRENARQAT